MSTAAEVEKKFKELFQVKPIMVRAPGRINLLGEHMDYNLGKTICAAIDLEIYFACAKNISSTHCKIFALDYNEVIEFDLQSFVSAGKHWSNYLKGVVAEIYALGKSITGFNCVFGGSLPQGAGLSSSAAITCGLAFSLNQIFNLQIENIEIAKLCQRAENNFANVKCGLLDPFSSLFGIKNQAMILDFKTCNYSYIELPINDFVILLFNSNVVHNLARSGHLNKRFESCYRCVDAIQKINASVNSLSDSSMQELDAVKNILSETDYNRGKYVLEEMERFNTGSKFLNENRLNDYALTLFDTHKGMKDLYDISCFELDVLIDFAMAHNHVIGAKMMGGGYGGCTVNIVARKFVEEVKLDFENHFLAATGNQLLIYEVEISHGVSLLQAHST